MNIPRNSHGRTWGICWRRRREKRERRSRREKPLVEMQKDLYYAITRSVLRELKEERIWIIDQVVLSTFDPQRMYPIVEKEDVPWRSWQNWLRERITSFCRENGKLNINNTTHRLQPIPSMASIGSVPRK